MLVVIDKLLLLGETNLIRHCLIHQLINRGHAQRVQHLRQFILIIAQMTSDVVVRVTVLEVLGDVAIVVELSLELDVVHNLVMTRKLHHRPHFN